MSNAKKKYYTLTMQLSDEQHELLERKAKELHTGMASIVKMSIEQVLRK